MSDTSALNPLYRKETEARHEEQLRLYTPRITSLLVGDSITERFLWFAKKKFDDNVLVLAKGGDRIEHLLWRLNHTAPSDKITSIVLQIGANNLQRKQSDTVIAAGIVAMARKLNSLFPHARIAVLPLYNVKDSPPSFISSINNKVRDQVSSVPYAFFLDGFWNELLPADAFDQRHYLDAVHLSGESYDWFYIKMCKVLSDLSKSSDVPTASAQLDDQ